MNKKIGIITVLIALLLIFPSVLAQEEEEEEGVAMIVTLTAIIILGVWAVIFATQTIKSYGKVMWGATFFLILAIVFFSTIYSIEFISILGLGELEEFTKVVWMHLFFYTGMALFITSAWKIKNYEFAENITMLSKADKIAIYAVIGWWVALIALIFPLNEFIGQFGGSIVDSSGVLHFIAFVLAGYTAVKVYSLKSEFGKTITNSILQLMLAIFCLGLIHLWELLTESWKVIKLPDMTIELTEQIIFAGVLILFIIAFWKMNKAVSSS